MNKQHLRAVAVCGLTFLSASVCFANGGRVTYSDGQPVVGAAVHVHLQEVDKYKLTTDANGHFTLSTIDFVDAFVQIKASDGKDYATVNLPAKVFEAGEVAVVLQPKK